MLWTTTIRGKNAPGIEKVLTDQYVLIITIKHIKLWKKLKNITSVN